MAPDLTGQADAALVRKNLVNHVMVVLDASSSMHSHRNAVREQMEQLVADLKESSTALDQETRISVYAFDDKVRCLVFDTDVLRTPPVRDLYQVKGGMTALNDATAIGLDDLGTISTLYGDHAFLAYVLTDGQENASRSGTFDIARRLQRLDDAWTVAAFVPDPRGRRYAEAMGIPADNIAMWSVAARDGFTQASQTMRAATASYMTARASGVRSTRSLFSTGAEAVNTATVTQTLQPLRYDRYVLAPVGGEDMRMDEAFRANGMPYQSGKGFYQFTKTEQIQPNKSIAIVEKKSSKVFIDVAPGSPAVRALLGLSDSTTVRVKPDANPDYTIFVQSTAPNRKVLRGTKVLMLAPQ